jgi:signal peptidase II
VYRSIPWIAAVVVLVLDRVSKIAIRVNVPEGSRIAVLPGLDISHVHNTGIAFSLFDSGGPLSRVLLHLVIVAAVIVIAWMMVRQGQHHLMTALGFGLILGGAVGNLVDRVVYGWVIDFIRVWVRFGERIYSWPDFNVADSSITVGAGLLILYELRSARGKDDNAPDSH